jgi:hypothetical protein
MKIPEYKGVTNADAGIAFPHPPVIERRFADPTKNPPHGRAISVRRPTIIAAAESG